MGNTGLMGGFKDVGCADDIDTVPESGVGAAEGDLEGGEVNDVGDFVGDEGLFDLLKIGDITLDEGNVFLLWGGKK